MDSPPFTHNSLRKTVIEPQNNWFNINLGELWEYRELFLILAWREVQLRYKQTLLGITWVILQPLVTAGVFTLVFGGMMRSSSDGLPYELFAFAGLLPWNVFSQSLQRAGISLVRDVRLITRIYFPRVIIPMANAVSTMTDFLVSVVLLAILLIIFRVPLSINALTIPILLGINLLISIGIGTVFAALNVYYRDFTYVLPFVIQIWMFSSPLAYSSNVIPERWQWIYNLNPLVGIIDGFRWALFGMIDFPMKELLYSLVFGVLVFALGLITMRRLERRFADVI